MLNAAYIASPGSSFLIDCKAVQLGAAKGQHWASAPSRRFGRAWAPLASALDDPGSQVVWMPAHCTANDVGRKTLSNGERLTSVDLEANSLVDNLAKRGAAEQDVQRCIKQKSLRHNVRVDVVATWLGQCTVFANEFVPAEWRDPGIRVVPLRDSEGMRRKSRLSPAKTRGQKRDRSHEASPSTSVPGQLPLCPKWVALKKCVLDRICASGSC